MKNEKLWGNVSLILVIIYVTIGGGYEVVSGITSHHIQTSFIFSFLSATIFIGRVFYGISSGAKRTIVADIYGALVMLSISILHIYYN